MYASNILKNIKFQIVNRYLSNDLNILHVDSILAESATIIFPVIDNIKYEEIVKIDVNGIVNIVDELSSFLKKEDKKQLKMQSRTSLYSFFLFKWASTLSHRVKKNLCSSISLISSIEDDGYLSLKGNDKVYKSILKVGPSKDQLTYGDRNSFVQEHVQQESLNNSNEESEDNHQENAPEETKKGSICDKCVHKEDYYDREEFKNKEYPLIQLWENEIYGETYQEVMPKVWMLKLSERVYLELKEHIRNLLAYCNSSNQIRLQDIVKRHFEKLFVFTAEWYRREYQGDKNNAFEEIHFKGKAKDIWDECPESYNEFIYRSENTSWLHSMYVLGGLPIKYRTDHFDQFYDNIISAINGDEDSFTKDLNFNNVSVRESLKNGSLNHFVKEIINGNLPFADEDLESDDIKNFVKYLKEGNERKVRNKFNLEWLITYSKFAEFMDRRLRVRMSPEEKGLYHNYISYERLSRWDVPNYKSIPNFKVCIRFNEDDTSIVELLKFSNQFTEGFVGWTSNSYLEVESHLIPPQDIEKIEILIKYLNGVDQEYKTVQTFNVLPYLQLYPTNVFQEWSTGVYNGKISAVLYRNTLHLKEQPDATPKQFNKTTNSDLYHWHEFTSSCTLLSDDEKSVKLFRKGDSLEIRPKLYKNLIEYNANDTLDFIQKEEGKEENKIETLVVFGRNGFEVKLTDSENSVGKEIEHTDYIIEYKKTTEHNYTEWTDQYSLEQGFYLFRVTVNEIKATIYAYYIPCCYNIHATPLKRNLNKHTIKFDHQITEVYDSKNNQLEEGEYLDEDTPENKYKYKLNFYLKDSESDLVIPVYRAWYRKELIVNGRTIVISNSESKKFDMALICKEAAYIRIIDRKGVSYPNNEDAGFCYFDNEVRWDAMGIKEQEKTTDHFKYIICHPNKNCGEYKISKEFRSEYVFYHWNYKINSNPQLIDSIYDEEKEILTLKKEILSTPGIVFQSLLGNKKPPRYWAPHFFDKQTTNDLKDDEKLRVKCFEIAKEHNVYFRLFQPLYFLVEDQGGMADTRPMDFFLTYAENKNYQLNEDDYKAFHRFADEFLFDWLFLCRDLWIRRTNDKNKKRVVEKLFLTNPHVARKNASERQAYRQIIQSYWSESYLPYTKWKVRASKNGGTALCYMHRYNRRDNHSYNFTGDRRTVPIIRDFLSRLYGEENYIQNVWSLIQEKLFKKRH